MNNIVILIGQRVRCGTNFIGSIMAQHPDVISVPPNTSLGEFNLFHEPTIKKVFEDISDYGFGLNLDANDELTFLKYYGELWLRLLDDKYHFPKSKTLFIKTFVIHNYELWLKAFPNAKFIFLCRDGRDNVVSSVKASNDKRPWHTASIKLKKRVNYYSGRSFVNHSIMWAKTARVYNMVSNGDNILKIKYEELLDSKSALYELLKFTGLNVDDQVIEACLRAPIMGSSFGINEKGVVKPNWKPDANKENYIFTGKWKSWGFHKKIIFNCLASKEMKMLGYKN